MYMEIHTHTQATKLPLKYDSNILFTSLPFICSYGLWLGWCRCRRCRTQALFFRFNYFVVDVDAVAITVCICLNQFILS